MSSIAMQHNLMGLRRIAKHVGANLAVYDMPDSYKINVVRSKGKRQNDVLDARKSSLFQISTKATSGSTVSMFSVKSVF